MIFIPKCQSHTGPNKSELSRAQHRWKHWIHHSERMQPSQRLLSCQWTMRHLVKWNEIHTYRRNQIIRGLLCKRQAVTKNNTLFYHLYNSFFFLNHCILINIYKTIYGTIEICLKKTWISSSVKIITNTKRNFFQKWSYIIQTQIRTYNKLWNYILKMFVYI